VNVEPIARVSTIISHADCPDGIASAMILHAALPRARVVFVEHNTPEHTNLPAAPRLLFCDIIPPPARSAEFVDAGAFVLDHHKGVEDIVRAFGERGHFADEKTEPGVSGALLAYRHVWLPLRGQDANVDRFASLAGIRDTWQTSSPDWDEACAQAAALTFYGYERLAESPTLGPNELEVGRLLLAKKLQTARSIAASKCFKLDGRVAMFNDRDRALSDVAHFVLQDDPEVEIVCGFHYKVVSDGRMLLVCSLRSRAGEVDVAAIARINGGGGHTSAAGFSVEVDGRADPLAVMQRTLAQAPTDQGG
jgi:hypothetical protein